MKIIVFVLISIGLVFLQGCASIATQRTYTEVVNGEEVIVQEITLKGIRGMKASGHDEKGKAWSGETDVLLKIPDFPALKYEAD